ncbi:MgtC/SapB family protein [Anaerobacillus alkaliphilus]|uniref:MgtC/SapB family protein n=1 Tax=Anaerobacillus alkaliphilus TaxID=1548597 RepID=A0A4Q0VMZ2_9BACI|nr:MgtC/SapB family protein [Anaerobacillus alkaliphilus]RXI96678.1 MgtC/SapB family protein [Anaerobacillus alkaliphilus]
MVFVSFFYSSVIEFFYDENVLKLALAALIGSIIGLERSLKHKPAGLKTAMILTVGSCLLTIVSIFSAELYSEAYTKPMDPLRLAAQVISGIGFIGGGVILVRKNDVISGITTAVMLWVCGAIGIAVGAGFYKEAILTLAFLILAVQILPLVLDKIGPKGLKEKEIKVRMYTSKEVQLTELIKQIKGLDYRISSVKVKEEATQYFLTFVVMTKKEMFTTDVFYQLKTLDEVEKVEVENLS